MEQRFVVFILVVLVFIFMQDITLAKTNIKITVEEGIDGKVKEGRGFPIKVTVENKGEDFKGDILFDYAPSYQTGGARAIAIDVPASSERTYTFSILGFNDAIDIIQISRLFIYSKGHGKMERKSILQGIKD